jgi:hypothetical protein
MTEVVNKAAEDTTKTVTEKSIIEKSTTEKSTTEKSVNEKQTVENIPTEESVIEGVIKDIKKKFKNKSSKKHKMDKKLLKRKRILNIYSGLIFDDPKKEKFSTKAKNLLIKIIDNYAKNLFYDASAIRLIKTRNPNRLPKTIATADVLFVAKVVKDSILGTKKSSKNSSR